jgi:predicted transcriptional regulator
MRSAVITARLDPETLALVDRVSRAQGRSRSWFAARAIRHVAEQEARFLAFVEEGRAATQRGEIVEHEEVEAMIESWIAEHEARCG